MAEAAEKPVILNIEKEIPSIQVGLYGSEGVSMQWLRKPEQSTHFMTRKFKIAPGGHIGVHNHPEDHQMIVLAGPLCVLDADGKDAGVAESGSFLYMPPEIPHGYRNDSDHDVEFICGIPKLKS